MQTPQLSVVIPVYNESGNLQPLVNEIEQALACRLRFEIVVVDDASDDATGVELGELAAGRPWLTTVSHRENRGQSAAIRTGVKSARAPARPLEVRYPESAVGRHRGPARRHVVAPPPDLTS